MLWLVLNTRCAYCRLARCALLAQMAMPHLMLLPCAHYSTLGDRSRERLRWLLWTRDGNQHSRP